MADARHHDEDFTQLSSQFFHAASSACGVTPYYIGESGWSAQAAVRKSWQGTRIAVLQCAKLIHSWALRHDISLAW